MSNTRQQLFNHVLQSHWRTDPDTKMEVPAYVQGFGPTQKLAELDAERARAQKRFELGWAEYEAEMEEP